MRLRKETLPDRDPGQMYEQRPPHTATNEQVLLPPLGKHEGQLCASVQLFPKAVTPAHVHARAHTRFYTQATWHQKHQGKHATTQEGSGWSEVCTESDSGALVAGSGALAAGPS